MDRTGAQMTRAGTAADGILNSVRSWLDRLPRPAPSLVDGFIAVAVLCASVAPLLVSASGSWWHLLLATFASVPLFWRRRWPLLVALIVGTATSGLAMVHRLPPLPFGSLVATYTFAALSPAPWRLVAMAVQSVAVVLSLLLPAEGPASFGYVGMAYVAAYGLGTGARARRAHISMLEERAARQEEERAAAAARERNQVAREVHDIVAHTVAVMVVQAEAGPVAVRKDPRLAEEAFGVIADSGREAILQLRRSLAALRSPEQDGPPAGQPGIADLERLLDEARAVNLRAGVERHGRQRPVPDEVDVAVYRLVQEAITNTIKHANATALRVQVRYGQREVNVEVTDDGQGATQPRAGGYGIIGMRERVTACGGTLRAGTGAGGRGFTVAATLPTQ
ncbi:sensor histidine kinase [Phytohabitans rumicis]|uniref:histidine kinase n=1 Tax=Phytohabitans rumicis TaxID=1076125 RepID=A0A6V8KNK4_9ACTN|nr:histidine kinase [Phytohabitans rumicis]GFJ86743.1 two-component sensor histidine kinase [Phytohabitans rumicis]